jgi:predicted nucleic acid-binding protein
LADRVVIDASVALAYLREEVGTAAARAAVATWTDSSTELLVPSHFWIEVTNSLVRRHAQPPSAVVEHFFDLDVLGVRTVEPDRPALLLAIDQMVRSGLSAYDAMYLALALSMDARLATLDRRLAEAAGEAGMLIGSSGKGLAESRAAYSAPRETYAGWSHSAIVGAHIAELRRRAAAGS